MNESPSPAPAPLPAVAHPSTSWPVLCHVAGLAGYLGIPFGNIAGPLIVWLVKRAEDPAVDAHGKEALNFQISWTIYAMVSGLLMFVVVGFVLLPVVYVSGLVLTIIGALKASKGEPYRYPLTIRLVS